MNNIESKFTDFTLVCTQEGDISNNRYIKKGFDGLLACWQEAPKFMQEWLDNLESGKYKKGKGRLLRESIVNEYCCLGVACKIRNIPNVAISHRSIITMLPAKYKLRIPKIFLAQEQAQTLLAQVNDNTQTFKQVIKLIKITKP